MPAAEHVRRPAGRLSERFERSLLSADSPVREPVTEDLAGGGSAIRDPLRAGEGAP